MEVRVDLDRCEANGVCVGIAPDIFDLDDNEELVISFCAPTGGSLGGCPFRDRSVPARGTDRTSVTMVAQNKNTF